MILLYLILNIVLFSLIHLFSWSGLLDSQKLLKDVFQVPNLQTGKMEPLIAALTEAEEEQFRNMLNRLETLFRVSLRFYQAPLCPFQVE